MDRRYFLRLLALLLVSALALTLTTCGESFDESGDGSSYTPGPWDSCTDEVYSAYNDCVNTECRNCVGFQCLFCLSYCSDVADLAAYNCCYTTFTGQEADECFYYFVPEARPCSVSGRVATSTDEPVPDVKLTTSTYSRTAFTNSNGDYRFSEIDCAFDGVTPSKSGYCFAPENRLYHLTPGTALTGQNFTALLTCYSLSGTITDSLGAPVSGVNVELSGDLSAATATDINGVYLFDNLSNGTYTVTPGIPASPQSRTVIIDNADISGQDFVIVD